MTTLDALYARWLKILGGRRYGLPEQYDLGLEEIMADAEALGLARALRLRMIAHQAQPAPLSALGPGDRQPTPGPILTC